MSSKCRIDNLRLQLCLSFTLQARAVTCSFEEGCFGTVKKSDVVLIGSLALIEFSQSCAG